MVTDPWSKGDYSRQSGRRPWRWMVFRRGFLLQAGCWCNFSWQPQRYREENGNSRSILGVSFVGTKYRPKGAPRGATGQPGGCLACPRGRAPGNLLEPWWWPSLPSLVFREASGSLIFYIIFPEFIWHF